MVHSGRRCRTPTVQDLPFVLVPKLGPEPALARRLWPTFHCLYYSLAWSSICTVTCSWTYDQYKEQDSSAIASPPSL